MSKPIATFCPKIDAPCAQLPTFERGQKRAFCDLCGKHVHNLSAMTLREHDQLFASKVNPCIRYARLIPTAVLLLAGSGWIHAQETSEQEEVFDQIIVTGGMRVAPSLEPMFLQSELDSEAALDDTSNGDSNEKN